MHFFLLMAYNLFCVWPSSRKNRGKGEKRPREKEFEEYEAMAYEGFEPRQLASATSPSAP